MLRTLITCKILSKWFSFADHCLKFRYKTIPVETLITDLHFTLHSHICIKQSYKVNKLLECAMCQFLLKLLLLGSLSDWICYYDR
jgi:SRSO17 transposase